MTNRGWCSVKLLSILNHQNLVAFWCEDHQRIFVLQYGLSNVNVRSCGSPDSNRLRNDSVDD